MSLTLKIFPVKTPDIYLKLLQKNKKSSFFQNDIYNDTILKSCRDYIWAWPPRDTRLNHFDLRLLGLIRSSQNHFEDLVNLQTIKIHKRKQKT